MQSISSEAWDPLVDDFYATQGVLGWTATVPAGVAAGSASGALMALMQGLGGSTLTNSGAGTVVGQQQLLTALAFSTPGTPGVGLQLDANVMLDTALSVAANSYIFFLGLADGTTSASNFLGIACGFNPILNAVDMRWALASATLAQIGANTPTAAYVPFSLPCALDVVQSVRLRISPDFKTIQAVVNGVAAPVMAVGSPYGGSTSVAIYPTNNAKITFGFAQVASAAQTAVGVIDIIRIQPVGRPAKS